MDKPGFGESTAVVITGKIMAIAIIVLFLVVVFVLCLHLYAKWFWWRREEPTSHPSRRSRRRFVFAPGQDAAHPQRSATKGLDSTILASLPALIFSQKDFKEGLECAVCLCELVDGDKARLLPKCNHGFHVDCIDMWFQSHSTCPLCRNPIVGVEVESPKHLIAGDEVNVQAQVQSPHDGYSTDSVTFPTNVLFWGNHTQVSSGAAAAEGGSASASIGSSAMAASSSGRQEGILVIDVASNGNENFTEEESKNPMPKRLRSLKRLLSREKRVVPNSSGSSSVDA
ncbi:23 kDa jasmonate-induced protein-like [Hibiscus syriacus]|uniref:RING-type E3 ubiquitin transferase n=1 Tax=Hibiscus syriacus TaxID=106335 RepID=A0A6A3BTK4_HIBSY|nr:RING-H2 finger protein ATL3-like [Hibiscus syriacus]KAE8719964.1 23 kDa jasmonate-induced protein-like [Hibiscus syriacus]